MKKQIIAFIAVASIISLYFVWQVYAAPADSSKNKVTKTIEFKKHPGKLVCTKTLPNGCEKGIQCPGSNQPIKDLLLKDYLAQKDLDIDISVPGDKCNTFDIDIGVQDNPCRCSGGRCYCWSDRRLKKNIQKIGQLENGLNVYTFNYIWDSTLTVGVMADEVRKVKPEAVININGFDLVDYSEILSMPMPQDINEILQALITQQPR